MAGSTKLEVFVVGDASHLNKTLDQAGNSAKKFGKIAAVGIGAGLGLAAVGMKKAVDAASSLEESQNAVRVVFGKSAKTIDNFSKQAARKAGLSMRELNELVTPLGAAFQNMGDSQKVAADKSVALAKRAADMASVFNVDVKDALGAIQAGLRGEADPLERFGVGLSDAAVTAQALTMGLAKTKDELTAGDKAQARYALLMKQTDKVAGDFTNTSQGLANQKRILRAELENFAATIGQKVIPIVTQVVTWIGDNWPRAVEYLQGIWEKIGPRVTGIVTSLRDIFVRAVNRIKDVLVANEPAIKRIFERVGNAMNNISHFLIPVLKIAFTEVLPKAIGDTIKAFDKLSGVMEDINAKKGPSLLDVMDKIGLKSGWVKKELDRGWHKGLIALAGEDIMNGLRKLEGLWQRIADWINRAGGHLKDFKKQLDGIAGPSGLDVIKKAYGKVKGDPARPTMTLPGAGAGAGGLVAGILDDLAAARSMGLRLTSGVRPGAVTKHGTPSDHASGKAIDVAGSAGQMARFFSSLIGNRGVKQAFYDPLGSIFGGIPSSYREGGHSDHVHVATYAKGGIFSKPTLGIIGERGPEAVVPLSRGGGRPMQVNLQVDGRTLASILVDPLRNEMRQLQRGGAT